MITRLSNRPRNQTPPSDSAGFTLIELMVVMGILAILVTLITSVSSYVMRQARERQTVQIQAILIEAIQAFKDANTPLIDPFVETNGYPPDTEDGEEYNPDNSGVALISYLTGELPASTAKPRAAIHAAREYLMKLPEGAWEGGTAEPIRDGWDKPMRYELAGGIGGRPVLISAGSNGIFDGQDDICSDEAN